MTPHHTAELEAMKSGYQEIKNRVNLLDKPLTVPFYQVVPRMRQLHSSLKPQIQERVFRLSGVGSPFTSLQLNTVNEHAEHISGTAPLTIGTDSLVPIVARSSKDESSPITGSQASERPTGRSSFRTIATIKNTLQYLNKLSSCMTTRKEPSSVASSILSDSPLEPTMIQQTTLREDSATTRPFGKSQTGETARSPHILANRAMGKAARSEILVPQAGRNTDAMNEARLARPKGIIINQICHTRTPYEKPPLAPILKITHREKRHTLRTICSTPTKHKTNPQVTTPRLDLQSSIMARRQPGPPLFWKPTWSEVEFNLEGWRLIVARRGVNYTEMCWMLKFKPSNREEGKYLLEFLQSLFLFSDYIYTYRLLPPQFLKNIKISRLPYISSIIELQVKTMFLKNREFFHATESMIPQMDFLTTAIPSQHHIYLIRTRFCRGTFFNVARQLSSALREAPDMDYRARDEYLSVVSLIDDMIKFFQDPPRGELPTDKDRVEFQIIFTVWTFRQVFPTNHGCHETNTDDPSTFRTTTRLHEKFPQIFPEPVTRSESLSYFKKDRTFMKMYRDRSAENESLRQWIR
ncbi:hypothetical protein KEM48_006961 [Puccinia striiformis f. sp. tritici PST-130]|nr:hypothetical protein KEM48_006961 [Puccinia striiformis f. sp. tritici PST-130]